MARIFYHTASGAFYGVIDENDPKLTATTPDGRPKIELPDGVSALDLPGVDPSNIPWPTLPNGLPGNERTTVVVGGALQAKAGAQREALPKETFIDRLTDAEMAALMANGKAAKFISRSNEIPRSDAVMSALTTAFGATRAGELLA